MDSPETNAHPMDLHVGRRLQQRRKMLNLSQKSLAAQVGITFQQVQKYERAANRVSAGKLFDFARILSVPIYYFFQGYPGFAGVQEDAATYDATADAATLQAQELVRSFLAIGNPAVRKQILDLVRTLRAGDAA